MGNSTASNPFVKGHKLARGRPKGSRNKKSELREQALKNVQREYVAEQMGFTLRPIEEIIGIKVVEQCTKRLFRATFLADTLTKEERASGKYDLPDIRYVKLFLDKIYGNKQSVDVATAKPDTTPLAINITSMPAKEGYAIENDPEACIHGSDNENL